MTGKILRTRIISAVIVISAMIGALWIDRIHRSGWGLATTMAIFVTMGLREFYRMANARGWHPFSAFGIVMGVLLVFGHERWCLEKWHNVPRLSPDLFTSLLAVTVLGVFLIPIIRRKPMGATADISTTFLGLIYVWFLPSFMQRLRHLGMPGANGWATDGVEFVVVCIFVAKCSDVGGLLVGSKLGKHKLCPVISPKKTVEGMLGGILFSVAAISLLAARTHGAINMLSWPSIIGLGVVLAVSSLLGDLVESVFKRDTEIKDAGTSVPGFGGVLDLVDSLMLSAPAMYYYLVVICNARAGGG